MGLFLLRTLDGDAQPSSALVPRLRTRARLITPIVTTNVAARYADLERKTSAMRSCDSVWAGSSDRSLFTSLRKSIGVARCASHRFPTSVARMSSTRAACSGDWALRERELRCTPRYVLLGNTRCPEGNLEPGRGPSAWASRLQRKFGYRITSTMKFRLSKAKTESQTLRNAGRDTKTHSRTLAEDVTALAYSRGTYGSRTGVTWRTCEACRECAGYEALSVSWFSQLATKIRAEKAKCGS
jgi:hypothetical protein